MTAPITLESNPDICPEQVDLVGGLSVHGRSYFTRLVRRTPRFGRVLLVLAAVAGLFAAVWTGPAAGIDGMASKRIELKVAPTNSFHHVKICGGNEENEYTCTRWTPYSRSEFDTEYNGITNMFYDYWWQGSVTICMDGVAALPVQVPTRYQEGGDWYKVDLTGFYWWSEAPLPEDCVLPQG